MKLLWALLAVLLAIMAIFAGTGKADAEPYGFGRGGFGRGGFGGRYGGYGGFGGRGYGGFGRGFYG